MKRAIPYLTTQVILSLVVSFYNNEKLDYDFLTTFGLFNLIFGLLGLVLGGICSIIKEHQIARALVISSALLLLMGFLTCSVFPFKYGG